MDLAAMRAVMEANGPIWATVISGDLDPERVVVRHRDDGSDSFAPLGVRLAQALHHGTDHRSQICTALTSLGVEPPEIDVWDYASLQGRLSETEPTSPRRAESDLQASAPGWSLAVRAPHGRDAGRVLVAEPGPVLDCRGDLPTLPTTSMSPFGSGRHVVGVTVSST